MVHTFKFGGQRIAYDSVSGLTLPLSELAYKMLDYIELPMPKECSSALRYDLAKFDSAAISDTYDQLYALYRDGKLFAEGDTAPKESGGAVVAVGDTLCTHANPHVLDIAKTLADEGKDVTVRVITTADGAAAIGEEELSTVIKELEKLSKEQIKRARGDIEGIAFEAFKPLTPVIRTSVGCANCWANKLCTLEGPMNTACELEKKRIECVMMCRTASNE